MAEAGTVGTEGALAEAAAVLAAAMAAVSAMAREGVLAAGEATGAKDGNSTRIRK
jgi:hypothetical protein